MMTIDVPDGIIAHLTRQCGGNVHERKVVEVTSSKPYNDDARRTAQNVADFEVDSTFDSGCVAGYIRHTRNNWVCYDFNERRIVPTHYTIRTNHCDCGGGHVKSWLVETSADGANWRDVDHKEKNDELNGKLFTATFAVVGCGTSRVIRW
jgi:hypothetical protein